LAVQLYVQHSGSSASPLVAACSAFRAGRGGSGYTYQVKTPGSERVPNCGKSSLDGMQLVFTVHGLPVSQHPMYTLCSVVRDVHTALAGQVRAPAAKLSISTLFVFDVGYQTRPERSWFKHLLLRKPQVLSAPSSLTCLLHRPAPRIEGGAVVNKGATQCSAAATSYTPSVAIAKTARSRTAAR
jgi:hypothetical protein